MPINQVCPDCGTNLSTENGQGTCVHCQTEPRTPTADPPIDAPSAGMTREFVPSDMARLVALLPHLELLEEIGRGGMGVVYKARHVKLDRLIALKLIRPDSDHDPAFAERFAREARAMARLNHPNILTIYDFGEVEGLYYLVMELVEGENLRHRLRTGPLDEKEAYDLTIQVCEGLDYAHDRGVIHRDIKPENILIDIRGLAKLADFGLAKLVEPEANHLSLTRTRQVLGTPRYMAPEQFEGAKEVDHRVDIYSVGVVLYEMLVGVTPAGRFELPSKARPGIDEKADPIVLRALQHDPIHRYSRASDFKDNLVGLSGSVILQRPDQSIGSPLDLEAIRDSMKWPAYGLAITGFVNYLAVIGADFYDRNFSLNGPSTLLGPLLMVIFGTLGTLILLGSYSLSSLKARRIGLFASWLAILPISPGSILGGAFFGIWSLVVLSRRDVIEAFNNKDRAIETPLPRKVRKVADWDLETVRRDLRWPARALIAVGILDCLTLPIGIAVWISVYSRQTYHPPIFGPSVSFVFSLVFIGIISSIVSIPLLWCGIRARSLDHRMLAISACLLAALPITPVALFGGFLVGVWTLAILTRRDVAAAFAAKADGHVFLSSTPSTALKNSRLE